MTEPSFVAIYDAVTLEETGRVEGDWVRTPTGKFNVYNTAHEIY
jgi:nitrite reductase (NO-forming)/hydroxylamine reductase